MDWKVVLVLEVEGTAGLDCGGCRCPSLGDVGLSWENCLAAVAPELPACETFPSCYIPSAGNIYCSKAGWKVGFTEGFLPDPPNPVLCLLSLRALLCRAYHTVPLYGLMHWNEQEEFSVASTSLKWTLVMGFLPFLEGFFEGFKRAKDSIEDNILMKQNQETVCYVLMCTYCMYLLTYMCVYVYIYKKIHIYI